MPLSIFVIPAGLLAFDVSHVLEDSHDIRPVLLMTFFLGLFLGVLPLPLYLGDWLPLPLGYRLNQWCWHVPQLPWRS